jgi:hypothetical protein
MARSPESQEAETAGAAVWVATAILHRRHPERGGFSTKEIEAEVKRLGLWRRAWTTIPTHINQHCVANRRPNPNKLRFLFEVDRRQRRLFRRGDPSDPRRETGRTHPEKHSLPPQYRELVDWYETEYAAGSARHREADPILALRGRGKGLWTDEAPDEYVRRLRAGWP